MPDLSSFTPLSILIVLFYGASAFTLAATVGTIAVMLFMRVFKLREALILIRALDAELQTLSQSPNLYVAEVARKLHASLHNVEKDNVSEK